MTQEKQVNFDTVYQTVANVTNILINMTPESATPNTVQANLASVPGKQLTNNTEQIEGELLMAMKNTLYDIDFEVDDEGNLIVHAADADNYSIDGSGFLIYTYR